MKIFVSLALSLLLSVCFAQDDRGLPSEGREFFLGYLHPTVGPSVITSNGGSYGGQYKVYALVSSAEGNEVYVSYYNTNGTQQQPTVYTIPAGTTHILLEYQRMRYDSLGDKSAFLACHITARRPISIQYLSTGPNSGGSYLALPVHSWGRKHVVATYNDYVYGVTWGGDPFPFNTSGIFTVVAAYPGTVVTIIPTAQTCGGHTGVNQGPGANGTPQPYSITLSPGECYFVRSASSLQQNTDDLSSSIIISNHPVAVIAGHENAHVGDGGVLNSTSFPDTRDFMIEQMIPVEFWDNTGIISIPYRDSDGPIVEGIGENYRLYVADEKVPSAILGNGASYYSGTFAAPVELNNRTAPISFSAVPDTSRFMTMQYDLRSHGTGAPFSAPSMNTLIPMSQWRTSYAWSFPFKGDQYHGCAKHFVTVICEADKFNEIMVSVDNAAPLPIGNALKSVQKTWNKGQIPDFPGIKAVTYSIAASINGAGGRYKATAPFPFMIYHFGNRGSSTHYLDCSGNDNNLTRFYSYASPGGASLFNKAVAGNLSLTVDTLCSGGWKICATDNNAGGGIRYISLLDDPKGNLYPRHSYQYSNVSIHAQDDPQRLGEFTLPGDDKSYCFKININDSGKEAYAPIIIYDKAGNYRILELRRSPNSLVVTPDPFANSDLFAGAKLGVKICKSFTIYNDQANQSLYTIDSLSLPKTSKFTIENISHTFPATILPGGALLFDVCFQSTDTLLYRDTIKLFGPCLELRLPVAASTVRPILIASDINYGEVEIGKTSCKTLTLKNAGGAAFTVHSGTIVQSANLFAFDSASLTSLPMNLNPGQTATMTVCYTPDTVRTHDALIDWQTDILPPFASEHKATSLLSGTGHQEPGIVITDEDLAQISIHPNPARDRITISHALQLGDVDVRIYDVIGQEILHQPLAKEVVELPQLAAGRYYVRLQIGKVVKTFPFVLY